MGEAFFSPSPPVLLELHTMEAVIPPPLPAFTELPIIEGVVWIGVSLTDGARFKEDLVPLIVL